MKLLPETDDRPVRPDLPWLRNLSWTKIHALQIGFFVGLLVCWGVALDQQIAVFAVVLYLVQYAIGGRVVKSDRQCDHNLGIHDLRLKPWYFATALFWTVVASSLLFGVP